VLINPSVENWPYFDPTDKPPARMTPQITDERKLWNRVNDQSKLNPSTRRVASVVDKFTSKCLWLAVLQDQYNVSGSHSGDDDYTHLGYDAE